MRREAQSVEEAIILDDDNVGLSARVASFTRRDKMTKWVIPYNNQVKYQVQAVEEASSLGENDLPPSHRVTLFTGRDEVTKLQKFNNRVRLQEQNIVTKNLG